MSCDFCCVSPPWHDHLRTNRHIWLLENITAPAGCLDPQNDALKTIAFTKATCCSMLLQDRVQLLLENSAGPARGSTKFCLQNTPYVAPFFRSNSTKDHYLRTFDHLPTTIDNALAFPA